MDDLMLHILDVAMNSVGAGARTVRISIVEAPSAGCLRLAVADNGPGMGEELRRQVLDDYATTKAKQPGWVGFGLALLRGTCELVEGRFHLLSRPGAGTLVVAELPYHHPDRPPLGDVAKSLQTLIMGCPQTDFCLDHRREGQSFRLDTRPVRRVVGEAYGTPAVRRWLAEILRDGEGSLVDRGALTDGRETS